MSDSHRTALKAGHPMLRVVTTAALAASSLSLPALLLAPARWSQAQSQSLASAQRIVQGKVLAGDRPVQGAIVYLKNAKTLEVRTYISTTDGNYRFGQLGMDADYSLWAEYQGKKSKDRTISSFDSKRVFDVPLRVESK